MRWSLLTSLGLLSSQPALACGGLFCNAVQPVDQAGERILFAIDEAAGEVEVHVQITYAGPAEEFSWILPTPSMPEVFQSVDDAFSRLAAATNPTFIPVTETVGSCSSGIGRSMDMALSAPEDAGGNGEGVFIAAEAQVGPYDTQILTAADTTTLVTWLGDNGYDLPEGAEEKIAPYVQAGGWFVGLKLHKDRDAGDLAPIGVRYAGTEPMIPLQLTAVAVQPDMPLQPFVLGSSRAVPENYLHVTLNPFAVDWLTGAGNYTDVIRRAADEAGGQAFATDFAGTVGELALHFANPGQHDLDGVAGVRDAVELADHLLSLGYIFPGDTSWQQDARFPVTNGTIPILSRFVPKPARFSGEDDANFYSCLDCYLAPGDVPVDGLALSAALKEEWVKPMLHAQELLYAAPWLTRMTSSISGDEMTADPRFVLNPDLGPVAAARQATLKILCNGVHQFNGAPRRLVMPDGRELDLPSVDDWTKTEMTWDRWVAEVGLIATWSIEQTGRSGDPLVIQDNSADIDAALAKVNGCGCNGTGGGSVGILAGLGLLWRRRGGRRGA